MPAPPALLNTTPDLITICNKVLGHAYSGDGLVACLANGVSYYYDYVYVNNYNNSQLKFAKYGEGSVTTSGDLQWAYNSTAVQTFTVSCNHSTWKFHSYSVASGWTIAVYDSTNTDYLGGLDSTQYPSGAKVRVNPNSTNSGGTTKYCYLYCGTWNDFMVYGGTFTGTQLSVSNPPVVVMSSPDGSITLINTNSTLAVGTTALTLNWTPTQMNPATSTNYIQVVKSGGVLVGSYSRTCVNGNGYSTTITLNESAVAGRYYYANFTTTLA